MNELTEALTIKDKIYFIRGIPVMYDSDLAGYYNVETKNLNRAMKRNLDRFPESFCFQVTRDELLSSRCQNGTLNTKSRGSNIKYLPYVYSEQGVAMMAGVLHSETAVRISIAIINVQF